MSDNVQQKKLTPRQARAVAALLEGHSHQEAATHAGVQTKTLERWRKQPHFDDALRKGGAVAIGDATRRLTGALDCSVSVMRTIMEDEEQTASVRLRAANYIQVNAIKLLDVTEVMERLEALEALVNAGK